MKKINTQLITDAVSKMLLECMCNIDSNTIDLLKRLEANEKQELPKFALKTLLENNRLAKEQNIPFCQDTGMAVVFVEIGQQVFLQGDLLKNAINKGVEKAYNEGYFRKSVVDPLTRQNTKTNTPAVIHTSIVEGDKISITVTAKGFGSENMSKLYMLTPQSGENAIIEKVLECVKEAGSKPCPPIILGIGIGGTIEKCTYLAKYALTRNTGEPNKNEAIAKLEKKILDMVNSLNIGVHGLGGASTALAVHCETFPTHIAGLPVCININCFATRHAKIKI